MRKFNDKHYIFVGSGKYNEKNIEQARLFIENATIYKLKGKMPADEYQLFINILSETILESRYPEITCNNIKFMIRDLFNL